MKLRSKLRAAALHFLVTAALASAIAALVFMVWFPNPFASMMDSVKLFFIVLGCDLVLGPLMSLVVYNPDKSRRMLIVDYAIIGLLQVAALAYGVFVVAQYRPAYIVFIVDRYEVISTGDLDPKDQAEAVLPEYRHVGWLGPELVVAVQPDNDQDRNQALFQAIGGKDLSQRPKYFRPYARGLDMVAKATKPFEALYKAHPDDKAQVQQWLQQHGLVENQTGWLPVKHPRGFWTAMVDLKTHTPRGYLPIDPYE